MTESEAIKVIKDILSECTESEEAVCYVTGVDAPALEMAIKALEQKPKTGHWIVVVDKWGDIITTVSGYRCSECNAFNTDEDNYCPNCGTKMQAESEVKE